MSSATKANILKLFDRPKEFTFMPKGHNNEIFDVPAEYLLDEHKDISNQIFNKIGGEASKRIPVATISIPDLGDILQLKRDEHFSLFIPKHGNIAGRLINIYLGMRNADDLFSVLVYTRDRVNPYLFNYALSVALLHRPDTQDMDLPSFLTSFPDKFVDSKVFAMAREKTAVIPDMFKTPIEIPIDFTASNLEVEHRLAYFREDIGVNLHHWHWHLVYPIVGAIEIVNKNRRGELFYYMHQQIIARYNFERLSNKMHLVERFIDWHAPIPEAYFPKLDSQVTSRTWPARVANQKLRNLRREADKIKVDLDDMIRWRDRIYGAIHVGSIRNDQGKDIPLTEFEGIDVLGNIIEASTLSPNRELYGNLHNMGHNMIAFIHDPDHRHLEQSSVMGDSATAMRDPIFYRWHAFIDDIFQRFKLTLPRYTVEQLSNPGITVYDVFIESGEQLNTIQTFWQQSEVDISRGMDYQPRGELLVRFTHLQHQEFKYKIKVNNQSSGAKQVTCRIFLAPKHDERGNSWLLRDQKNMFIELDKFKVNLQRGRSTITRPSTLSSVTIPFDRTFRNVDSTRPEGGDAQFNFCGCGWPQHMLVPKGTHEGMECQLFVMLSNYDGDKIDQNIEGSCRDADSFCGIKDKLYPDRRSMGYPFDRIPRKGVETLEEFLTPNMKVQDVIIKFTNKTVKPSKMN